MLTNTVLVVEDDPDIRELLRFTLERAGLKVVEAESGEDALTVLDGPQPSVAIIDWMLPGINGVELTQRLRKDPLTSAMPLIMLTARGEEADKLKSFDSGIDDYLTKPFSPKELVARVKALIRRTGLPEDGHIIVQGLDLDINAHRLTINGDPIPIGPTEFSLLELLMSNPNRAFGRAQLLDRVWGRSVYVEERTVDVHILRLRKALSKFDLDRLVQTVRGIGYRFSEDESV
ncbi:MAG: response regulator [Pseudomonadales bacterium]|nr:response regulator [Pseudomonadales bacterium]